MFKKLFLITSLLLISTNLVVAADNPISSVSTDNFYDITDFSGGLKSHYSTYLTPKNASTISQNVRYNKRYGSLVKRDKMLQLSACRSFAVKSLYRYYKSDATKYSIETSSTFMDYIADSTGSCTALASGLSDSKRWNWVTYKDVAIGTNGTDRPKKWDGKILSTANTDGARTAGDLITELGAPFTELNTGSDLEASKWYQYKVAYYDGSVYKFSTARSNPILTGSSVLNITLTDIPLGPTGTTARMIYRTLGQTSRANVIADTTYYKVATISDNATRTYNDAIADATIAGDAAPTWATVSAGINVSPPYAKFSLINRERLFLANDISGTIAGKSTIYWSDVLNPDYFNFNTDYEVIRPDDGDQITVIKSIDGRGISVGKEGTWSKFYTDAINTADWTIGEPFSFQGCIAPYSAVNTTTGLIYLGRHGLYTLSSNGSELISDVVTDVTRDILETNQNEVSGIYQDNQYHMAYTSKATGSGFNDRVLILDIVRNSYTQDIKNIDSWANFESGTDFGTLYSGSSTTDGKVYAHSGQFEDLVYRYKSQLDTGTYTATYSGGTEEEPFLSLGWDKTWTTVTGTWASQGSSTWLIQNNTGTWVSPPIQIDASSLSKIYWNEDLGANGNVTFAIKTADTSGNLGVASYSSEFTNPSGSNISAVTPNHWIQIRATLTSANYTETPSIILQDSFLFHLQYQKEGTTAETSILSVWKSGYSDLGSSESPNRIKEVQLYYEGTVGTMTITFENDAGTTYSFPVDLSILPSASTTDQYYGNSTEKIYVFIPPITDSWSGRKWRITVSEGGSTSWKVNRIVIRKDTNSYVTFK